MKRSVGLVILLCAIAGNMYAAYPAWSGWVNASNGNWQAYLRTPIYCIQDAKAMFQIQARYNGSGTTWVDHLNIKFIEDDIIDDNDYDANHTLQNFYGGTFFDQVLVTTGTISEGDNTEEMFSKVRFYYTQDLYNEVETPKINITVYSDDAYEDNDSYGAAYSITGGSYGQLIMADAADWYKFTVPAATRNVEARIYNFYNSIGNLNLYLYSTNGTTLLHSSTTSGNEEKVGAKNLTSGGTYYIKVQPAGSSDKGFYDLTLYLYTGVEGEPIQITPNYEYSINSYPNPNKGSSTIEFSVAEQTWLSINLYNVSGQHVAKLVDNQFVRPGRHTIQWNSRNANRERILPGVYLLRMEYSGRAITKRMIVIN